MTLHLSQSPERDSSHAPSGASRSTFQYDTTGTAPLSRTHHPPQLIPHHTHHHRPTDRIRLCPQTVTRNADVVDTAHGTIFIAPVVIMSSGTSSHTPASVAALISNNLYDPRIVPVLEEYVQQQVRTSTYDFPPNRHLLSLYLSNPDSIRHDILRHLLLLSLSSFPSSHFLSLAYTLPLPLQQQPPYNHIFRLHSLLSSGHYKRYWQERSRETGEGWPGYDERVRGSIIRVVERVYTRVSVYVLMELLSMEKREVEERCRLLGWKAEEDGKMIRVGGAGAGKDAAMTAGDRRGADKRNEVLSEEQLAKLLALVHTA
jgi:hypothetical protein